MSPASPERTEFVARLRYARITARKARLVADELRGKSVNRALEMLQFAPQRAASFYAKLVRSAMANAAQDEGVDVNLLVISDCRADDGPMLQNRMRYRPGPQGRAMPFKKLTSHLTVRVREEEEGQGVRRRRRASGGVRSGARKTGGAPAPAGAEGGEES